LFLPVVALPDNVVVPDDVVVPDELPDDVAPAAFPAAVPELLLEEEALGEACVLCGEQKFQVGNNKLATKTIKNS
jgi:hypothetical protein